MRKQPNIVLIVTDQWRGDCIGALGHPVVETPNLDNIFQTGTLFTHAYSAVPSCIAARAALLTGLSQRSHGRVGYRDGVAWNYPRTLPGLLAEAGYHTHCVGKMHVHPARNLMGFHSVQLHDFLGFSRTQGADTNDDYLPWLRQQCGSDADLADTGLGANGYSVRPWPYPEQCHPSHWVTSESVAFLRRRDPTKPFFLKASYHRPHPPLDPPAYDLDRYQRKELPPITVGDWARDKPLTDRGLGHPVPHSQAQIDQARRAYYAQISHIDNQINRLVRGLSEQKLLNDTLLMFVSDHGEMLYDHNLLGKGMAYQASSRIPFMIRLPSTWETPVAARVDKPVELRDILPTLLDAASVPIPDTIEGASILPLCRGDDVSWRTYLHGEHCGNAQRSNHWVGDGNERYVWYAHTGEAQYFRLDADPDNQYNVISHYPERAAFWRKILIEELRDREEGFVQNGDVVAGRPLTPVLASARQGDTANLPV